MGPGQHNFPRLPPYTFGGWVWFGGSGWAADEEGAFSADRPGADGRRCRPFRNARAIGDAKLEAASKKVIHIPNGVDCSRFAQAPAAGAKLGFQRSADELIVGTVAPLRPEKNLAFLLETFATIAMQFDAKLVIVGDGSERLKLTQLAEMLDIADRVHFTGHVEAIETVLTYFDVFALTSRTEQMPFSVLQAMAAGKPIATVDVGDVKRMLSPENRALVTPKGDLPAFAEMLSHLLEDLAARDRIGPQNQGHVRKHYPRERMLEAYRKLFEAVTPGRETRDRKTTLPAGRLDQESHNFSDV